MKFRRTEDLGTVSYRVEGVEDRWLDDLIPFAMSADPDCKGRVSNAGYASRWRVCVRKEGRVEYWVAGTLKEAKRFFEECL